MGGDLLEALAFSEENGMQMHATRCLEGLAMWSLAGRQPEEALAYAVKLEAIATPQGLREILTQALRLKSEAHLALGQLADAQEAIELPCNWPRRSPSRASCGTCTQAPRQSRPGRETRKPPRPTR